MARLTFDLELAPGEFRARLQRAFDAQEELIRKKLPAGWRGAFDGDDRFWIQVPDPQRSNQWNEAVLAAPPVRCVVAADGQGQTRVTVSARRTRRSTGVVALGALAAAGCLAHLLWVGGIFGRQGYVPGMRMSLGLSAGALLCVLLAMVGAVLWGRGDTTRVRMAVLRAVGLFGAGRAR